LLISRHHAGGNIRGTHELEPAAYRSRWKLSADHPLTAPGYSARRSAMAKQLGLGRKPRQVEAGAATPTEVPPAPKRRGRQPRSPSAGIAYPAAWTGERRESGPADHQVSEPPRLRYFTVQKLRHLVFKMTGYAASLLLFVLYLIMSFI